MGEAALAAFGYNRKLKPPPYDKGPELPSGARGGGE
jgi:hypothetical protein